MGIMDKVVWHFTPKARDKRRYNHMIARTYRFTQNLYPDRDIFDKLAGVHIYPSNIDAIDKFSTDLLNMKAAGIAYFSGDVAMRFQDSLIHDSQTIGMELGHHVLLSLLPGAQFADEFNNLIHWAANKNVPPWCNDTVTKLTSVIRNKKTKKLKKIKESITVRWYDVKTLINDMQMINTQILDDTAPSSPHKYWAVTDQAFMDLKGAGIIPGSVEELAH